MPARLRAATLARGVIVRASADTIVVCPPLIIQPKEIDLIAETLNAAIDQVTGELIAEGALPCLQWRGSSVGLLVAADAAAEDIIGATVARAPRST